MIQRIMEELCVKILKETLLFVDFSKTFYSLYKGKMEQILLAFGIPKGTFTALMLF